MSRHRRVVAIDQELHHLLEPLRGELSGHVVVTRAEPDGADVYITTEIDVGRIRALRRQHIDLVIVVLHCRTQFPRALEHRTFVAAVNAGASAYLVDAPVPVVAADVVHVGRSRPRRASYPRHREARR